MNAFTNALNHIWNNNDNKQQQMKSNNCTTFYNMRNINGVTLLFVNNSINGILYSSLYSLNYLFLKKTRLQHHETIIVFTKNVRANEVCFNKKNEKLTHQI